MKAEWVTSDGAILRRTSWFPNARDGHYEAFIRLSLTEAEIEDKKALLSSWLDTFRDDARAALSLLLIH